MCLYITVRLQRAIVSYSTPLNGSFWICTTVNASDSSDDVVGWNLDNILYYFKLVFSFAVLLDVS